jgi:hypothetical protein
MEQDIREIKKGISDLKLSIIIGVLVAFFVSFAFVSVIMFRKIDDNLLLIKKIDNKTLDMTLIAK